MQVLFGLLSHFPLAVLHALGLALGWLVFLASPRYRAQFLANARQAGLGRLQVWRAVGESGKQIAELPRLWMGKPVPVQWSGLEHLNEALATRQGLVCLTPHLGAFEVAPQAYAQRFGQSGRPITVLFRPPRKTWLQGLVGGARARPGMRTASTTASGVKQLIKALRNHECVGILPDQVPPQGQGLWVPFFGKPAYTMTLSARLVQQTDSRIVVAWVQRLPWGRGYVVHVQPLATPLPARLDDAVAQISQVMESVIRRNPSQYLWGYARYKTPREVD